MGDDTLAMDKLRAAMRLIGPPLPHFIESEMMTDRIEDWSRVRSPSRALRRMKQGHKQNVVTVEVPKQEAISLDGGRTYYLHPVMMLKLRRATQP